MATLTDLSVSDSNYIIVTWDDENAYAYYLGLGHRASSSLTIPITNFINMLFLNQIRVDGFSLFVRIAFVAFCNVPDDMRWSGRLSPVVGRL